MKLGLGATAALALSKAIDRRACAATAGAAAVRLTLAPLDVELAPGIIVPSFAFNGTVPGPHLALGPPAALLEICNDTHSTKVVASAALPELVTIPSGESRRVTPRLQFAAGDPAGLKHYQAYCALTGQTAVGTLGPQPVPAEHGAARAADAADETYDHSYALVIQHWEPTAVLRALPFADAVASYRYASFDAKLLAASEPIKVRAGQRLRLQFTNTSALRPVSLALPQHRFLVVALDGNRVPQPRTVQQLYIGPGESVDALVTMDQPGRWILGATNREDRLAGLGRLIEYAGAVGTPVESGFGAAEWDYGWFGATRLAQPSRAVDSALHLLAAPRTSAAAPHVLDPRVLDPRVLDPTPQSSTSALQTAIGRRHRVALGNFTREARTLRLLDHAVEIVSVAGRRTAGIIKDVVTLPSYTRIDCEFIARTARVVIAHDRQVRLAPVPPAAPG